MCIRDRINNYGADSVRLFILSDSPPEKDIQWSEQGMIASYKFIQKFWVLHKNIISKIDSKDNNIEKEDEFDRFVNETIDKFNYNLERFNYNVLIAKLYETYNYLSKIVDNKINGKKLKNNYFKILVLISPIIPHFASECIEKLKVSTKIKWPKVDKRKLIKDTTIIVIQFNGKKRGNIITEIDIDLSLIHISEPTRPY